MAARTALSTAGKLRIAAVIPVAAVGLAACGSSSSGGSPSATSTPGSGASSSPSTSFSVATVSGLGQVVVDGSGKTIYILTGGGHKNLPCTDASGCTAIWPDLSFPDGVKSATAGSGIQASLLGSKKLSDGETYPTYNGYLMYEYAADTGPAQSGGEGIKSYGGTWYALSPSGMPITSMPSGSSSSGTGGYSY